MRRKLSVIIQLTLVILAAAGLAAMNTAQEITAEISIICLNGFPTISVSDWEAGETLTVTVNGEDEGSFTADTDTGFGFFSFGEAGAAYDLSVARPNDEVVLAGPITCTGEPLEIESIQVSPIEATFIVEGSIQFSAQGEDAQGEQVEIAPIWTTNGGSISSDGAFTASEAGEYTVSAWMVTEGAAIRGDATAHVFSELARIEVIPRQVNVQSWESQTFLAVGYDEEDNLINFTPEWTASGGTITPEGKFSAQITGDYIVTASLPGSRVVGRATVQAMGIVERIEITPPEITLSLGFERQFMARGYDPEGNEVPIQAVWSATGGEIDSFGLYQAAEEGEFTIQATYTCPTENDNPLFATEFDCQPLTSEAQVLVLLRPCEDIIIHPFNLELLVGEGRQFEAECYDARGSLLWETIDGKINPTAEGINLNDYNLAWQSALGDITTSGLYTATIPGENTITVIELNSGAKNEATIVIEKSNTLWLWIIGGVVAVLIIGGEAIWYFKYRRKRDQNE